MRGVRGGRVRPKSAPGTHNAARGLSLTGPRLFLPCPPAAPSLCQASQKEWIATSRGQDILDVGQEELRFLPGSVR